MPFLPRLKSEVSWHEFMSAAVHTLVYAAREIKEEEQLCALLS